MEKEIVILARSVKHGQYCVAGKEIIRKSDKLFAGEWIRPISSHDDGALSLSEISYPNGIIPSVLDTVKLPSIEPAPSATQPENWIISPGKWEKTDHVGKKSLGTLVEHPLDLWIEPRRQADRISSSYFVLKDFKSSLCFISPDNFRMQISTVYNEFNERDQKRRRALFSYNGVDFDIAITDPDIDLKYFKPFPGPGSPVKTITPKSNNCFLTISLTPALKGFHYKLVATIIEI